MMIFEKCFANTNIDTDTFVGITCTGKEFEIHFPLGFDLPKDDVQARKDIMLLLQVLSDNKSDKQESKYLEDEARFFDNTAMPIQAYIYCIKDFLYSGYYQEMDVVYSLSKKGKINWPRTIKKVKPIIQDDEVMYLDFVTKKTTVNENELLTLIHKYCVWISFRYLGWIFTDFEPPKPEIKFNKALFQNALLTKLNQTFNDRHRTLFRNLLAIVNEEADDADGNHFMYGTDSFAGVWEKLINRIYGVANLSDYYPYTVWNFGDGDVKNEKSDEDFRSSSLRPDTVMIPAEQNPEGKVFVLDAKYYKYGWHPVQGNLPKSADINKQITYGEYISEVMLEGEDKVYNAFVMPFNSKDEKWQTKKQEERFSNEPSFLHWIGEAKSSWKNSTKKYEVVQGVLLDVKRLMLLNASQDQAEIALMAKLIEEKCSVKDKP